MAVVEEACQEETRRHEASEMATEDKDAELKAALAKVGDLEKTLQERDRTIYRERRGTLLEAHHLEESFSSKCVSFSSAGLGSRLLVLGDFF